VLNVAIRIFAVLQNSIPCSLAKLHMQMFLIVRKNNSYTHIEFIMKLEEPKQA
jgi:hypothetical protein